MATKYCLRFLLSSSKKFGVNSLSFSLLPRSHPPYLAQLKVCLWYFKAAAPMGNPMVHLVKVGWGRRKVGARQVSDRPVAR